MTTTVKSKSHTPPSSPDLKQVKPRDSSRQAFSQTVNIEITKDVTEVHQRSSSFQTHAPSKLFVPEKKKIGVSPKANKFLGISLELLQQAIGKGENEKAKEIYSQNPNMFAPDIKKIIFRVIKLQNLELLKFFLSRCPVRFPNYVIFPLVHECFKKPAEALQILKANKYDDKAKDASMDIRGVTPAMWALLYGTEQDFDELYSSKCLQLKAQMDGKHTLRDIASYLYEKAKEHDLPDLKKYEHCWQKLEEISAPQNTKIKRITLTTALKHPNWFHLDIALHKKAYSYGDLNEAYDKTFSLLPEDAGEIRTRIFPFIIKQIVLLQDSKAYTKFLEETIFRDYYAFFKQMLPFILDLGNFDAMIDTLCKRGKSRFFKKAIGEIPKEKRQSVRAELEKKVKEHVPKGKEKSFMQVIEEDWV